MQIEVVVTMERRPVTMHWHDGTVGEYEAKEVRYVDHI
jgi:hypothetical protein